MTDRPDLPPVAPGRSALPAFLAVEAFMEQRLAGARAEAEARLEAARAHARAVEETGRERLRQAVVDAEADALREVESRAVDRVSEARRAVEAWITRSEAMLDDIVAEAVARLVKPPVRDTRAVAATEAE